MPQRLESTWEAFPAVAAARAWSLRKVGEMESRLAALKSPHSELSCIVLCGSLARWEACTESDIDLIFVLHDTIRLDSAEAESALETVFDVLGTFNLRRPKPDGVFVSPTSRSQLCDAPRGIVTEAMDVFGKRIQLLLEARPIFGPEACRRLQSEILMRYASHPFAQRRGEYWGYLVDDLMRFWHSYRVWRYWDVKQGIGGWYSRNIKLRFSRLMSCASLLLACAVDSLEGPHVDSLLGWLELTPLERIVQVDERMNTGAAEAIIGYYDRFLLAISDPELRRVLTQASAASPQDALVNGPPIFNSLLDDADGLRSELVRLMLSFPESAKRELFARLLF